MSNEKPEKTNKRLIIEYFQAIMVAVVLALFVRHFFIEAYKIPSDAMIPTLLPGDYIFINKLRYFSSLPLIGTRITTAKVPQRGDVVVFSSPVDRDVRYIKRVIGVPGDTIKFEESTLSVNGEVSPEQPAGEMTYKDPETGETVRGLLVKTSVGERYFNTFGGFAALKGQRKIELTVPEGNVFVLGDNLGTSVDSRHFGFVPLADLKGKALFVAISWDITGSGLRLSRFGEIIR